MAHISKTMCEIFHFRFHVIFIKLYIFFQQTMDSLTLKRHKFFKLKITEKPHSVLLQDLLFLSCNRNLENAIISV